MIIARAGRKSCLIFLSLVALSFTLQAQDESISVRDIVDRTLTQVKQNIDQSILDYKQAKVPQKKFYASMVLSQTTQKGTFSDFPTIEKLISADQKKIVGQAVDFYEATLEEVKKFESSLTPKDIALVVKDHPDSIFLKQGHFGIHHLTPCDQKNIEEVQKAIPKKELVLNYESINALVLLYEDLHMYSYRANLRKLLQEAPEYKKYSNLLETYYYDYEDTSKQGVLEVQSALDHYEQIFKSKNRKVPNIKAYIQEKALISPNCFMQYSQKFHESMKLLSPKR